MTYDPDTGAVVLCDEAMIGFRPFDEEDLDHLRDAILEIQEKDRATALPGLESLYRQVALRLGSKVPL